MVRDLFLKVLDISLVGSYVIMVVLLARLLLRKAPKIFSYVLWIIVLARLLNGFTFESNVGMLPRNDQSVIHNFVTSSDVTVRNNTNTQQDKQIADKPTNMVTTQPSAMDRWITVGSYLWAAGIVGMVAFSLYNYSKLRKNLVGAVKVEDNIWMVDNIPTPFVIGWLRPRIYIPSSLEEYEKEYVIAHEKYHIKRWDHIIRLIAFVALSIHWFNPLVWLAFNKSGKDMEMSCDEGVIGKLGRDVRKEYSMSLLKFSSGNRVAFATPIAFGESDTKGRVKNIMKYKKPMIGVVVLLVIAVIAFAYVFSSQGKKSDNKPTNQGQNTDTTKVQTKDDSGEKLDNLLRISRQLKPDEVINKFGKPDMELQNPHRFIYNVGSKRINLRFGNAANDENSIAAIVMTDNTTKKLTPDEAVSMYLLNSHLNYKPGEVFTEGHVILGQEADNQGKIKIYTLFDKGWYGFENGKFTSISGGQEPCVITLEKDNIVDYYGIKDGAETGKSIKKLFPKQYQKRAMFRETKDYNSMRQQRIKYAREYLKKINRDAEIVDNSHMEDKSLTYYGVSVEVSNKLLKYSSGDYLYPSYRGTRETLEGGVRKVYEQKYNQEKNQVEFIKYDYNTKNVEERIVVSGKTGEIIKDK